MTSQIVVNSLGLTYKGTIGMSLATIPDVCKTPSPGGPVPIPYPNFANQSSLKNGTKTVKAKGKMIAVKGSQYSRSNGDEAGTAGGVKSGVNMKATDWITYSFDVKMDGKNACRHTDKKFHNNQNTVDLSGNIDPAAALATLQKIHCNCCSSTQPTSPAETCQEYGNRVDQCCQDAIAEMPEPSSFGGERGYHDNNKQPFTDQSGNMLTRTQAESQGISFKDVSFPDACSLDSNGNVTQFFDFKTTCPRGQPYTNNKGEVSGHASGDKSRSYTNAFLAFNTPSGGKPSQFERYKSIGDSLNPPTVADPVIIHDANC